MTRINTETQRLFGLSAQAGVQRSLVGADGCVRGMVLALTGPADWALLAPLWRGVQTDLGWPAPSIAVNGREAFELWFSLAEPLPFAEAARLLAQLQLRYLGGVRSQRLRAWPGADAVAEPPAVPPFAVGPERWAAFIAPDLPAVFGDDPVLDFEPGADAQAELLSRQRVIGAAELQMAQAVLAADEPPAAASMTLSPAPPLTPHRLASGEKDRVTALAGSHQDPRAFLLAVMNDTATPLALRIDAAKGLLMAHSNGGQ